MYIPVYDSILKEKALKGLLKFNKDNFITSNGCLHAFVSQHKVKRTNLHCERAEDLLEVTEQRKGQMLSICEGYCLKAIYNCDKTGIFILAIPLKSSVWQDEVVGRTKVLIDHFTFLLTCSAIGRNKLWFVGKANWPNSSPNINLTSKMLWRYGGRVDSMWDSESACCGFEPQCCQFADYVTSLGKMWTPCVPHLTKV